MTEQGEKIIVFQSFDNVIKANIIKTKLDAYGIPCFLTDENFVNLYPLQNELFPGVRLHIFERDLEKVKEVLVEEKIPENDIIRCPRCQSKNVAFEERAKGPWGKFFLPFISLLIMEPLAGAKKVNHCLDCDSEFNA